MTCPKCGMQGGLIHEIRDVQGGKVLWLFAGSPKIAGYIVQCPNPRCAASYMVDRQGRPMVIPSYSVPRPVVQEGPPEPTLPDEIQQLRATRRREQEQQQELKRRLHDDDLKFEGRPE